MNIVELESKIILYNYSAIKKALFEYVEGFMIPDEILDYATRTFKKQEFYFIYKVICINPINPDLSGPIIIIYDSEQFKIFGYRENISTKLFKKIFLGLRLYTDEDFLNGFHQITLLSANRALYYNGYDLINVEKHIYPYFGFLIKRRLLLRSFDYQDSSQTKPSVTQKTKLKSLNNIAKEKLKNITKQFHKLFVLYRVYYTYYNEDLDAHFYYICDVLIFRSYHILVDIYICPSKVPNKRINTFRINFIKNLEELINSIALSKTTGDFLNRISKKWNYTQDSVNAAISNFIYEAKLKTKLYGTNEFAHIDPPEELKSHYCFTSPLKQSYKDDNGYFTRIIANVDETSDQEIDKNEFSNEFLRVDKLPSLSQMISIYIEAAEEGEIDIDYEEHYLAENQKIKIFEQGSLYEQLIKKRKNSFI